MERTAPGKAPAPYAPLSDEEIREVKETERRLNDTYSKRNPQNGEIILIAYLKSEGAGTTY